eukprot:jgi/Picre1/28382/NNA_003787.t1
MFFSIDVECVAVGTDHNARSVAQISLVNQFEQVLLNLYVRQEAHVVSYLTPLTGLSKEILDTQGIPLSHALHLLRTMLPKDAILVGQNISKDVEWLGLKYGQDFQELKDLTGLFRVLNPKYNSYSVFSQDHLVKTLLNWDVSGNHDAVGDAIKSIRLYHLYLQSQKPAGVVGRIMPEALGVHPRALFCQTASNI